MVLEVRQKREDLFGRGGDEGRGLDVSCVLGVDRGHGPRTLPMGVSRPYVAGAGLAADGAAGVAR